MKRIHPMAGQAGPVSWHGSATNSGTREAASGLYRAYLLDLWLFIRKVAPHALSILAVLIGSTVLFYYTGAWPGASMLDCFIRAFYMMTLEGVEAPHQWHLEIFILVLPALGLLFAGHGLVGATVLFLNKSQRQGEWNAVMAATYDSHTIVCGMGLFGGTLCDGLREAPASGRGRAE